MSGGPPRAGLGRGDVVGLRYAVELKIGQGGNGAVYLASDMQEEGRAVALKVLRSDRLDAEREKGLRTEYATLARLRHPHVEAVYDFGKDPRHGVYISKEYVAGADMFKATEGRPPEDVLLLSMQLFRALSFLHARGLIHNDLKPDNVLVIQDHSAELGLRSVLIDFGIASALSDQAATVGESDLPSPPADGKKGRVITGTLAYMAPERLRGAPADVRTDLYAAGIVLFRLLARRYPFAGDSNPREVMVFHLHRAAPRLREIDGRIAPAVDAVMDRLLAKRPEERYATARDVLQDLARVLARDEPLETEATQEGYVRSVALVGREGPLGDVGGLVARATEGERKNWESATALILGEAGMGKSRLLNEALVRARLDGCRVLVGVARRFGGALDPLRGPLRQLMTAGEAETALAVFEDGETREALGRTKMLEALARLLLERGERVVLAIEDLHHADDLTLDLLYYLARRLRAIRSARLACILTSRAPQNESLERFLAGWRKEGLGPAIQLGPLDDGQTTAYVADALGQSPAPEFVTALRNTTGGEPRAMQEALKFLMGAGVLSGRTIDSVEGWGWCADTLPAGAMSIFTARLGVLPPDARALLRVLALLDRPAPAGVVGPAAELGGQVASSVLSDLGRRELVLVRVQDKELRYTLAHDRMAEAVLAECDGGEAMRAHGRIVRALERVSDRARGEWLVDLAHHAIRAGDPVRAARHGLHAGARMEELFAWDRAEEIYLALVRLGSLEGAALVEASLRLARVKEERGDVGGALHWLARADRVAGRLGISEGRARALTRAAGFANRSGNRRKATTRAARAASLFERAGSAVGLAAAKEAQAQILSLDHDHDTALALVRESRRMHEELGDERSLAISLNYEGIALVRKGELDAAARCFEGAWEKGRLAVALDNLALIQFLQGRHGSAAETFAIALDEARRQGQSHEEARIRRNLGHLRLEMGELRDSAVLLGESVRGLEGLKDVGEAVVGRCLLARLECERGHLAAADEAVALARSLVKGGSNDALTGQLHRSSARIAFARGELEAAWRQADRAANADEKLSDRRSLGYDQLLLAEIAMERGRRQDFRDASAAARAAFDRARFEAGGLWSRLLEARGAWLWEGAARALEALAEVAQTCEQHGLKMLAALALADLAEIAVRRADSSAAQPAIERALAYARAEGAGPLEIGLRLTRAELLAGLTGVTHGLTELRACEKSPAFEAAERIHHRAMLLRGVFQARRGRAPTVLAEVATHARAVRERGFARQAVEAERCLELVAAAAGDGEMAEMAGRRARSDLEATGFVEESVAAPLPAR